MIINGRIGLCRLGRTLKRYSKWRFQRKCSLVEVHPRTSIDHSSLLFYCLLVRGKRSLCMENSGSFYIHYMPSWKKGQCVLKKERERKWDWVRHRLRSRERKGSNVKRDDERVRWIIRRKKEKKGEKSAWIHSSLSERAFFVFFRLLFPILIDCEL